MPCPSRLLHHRLEWRLSNEWAGVSSPYPSYRQCRYRRSSYPNRLSNRGSCEACSISWNNSTYDDNILRYNRGSQPKLPQDITLMITANHSTNIGNSWVLLINEILELFSQTSFAGRVKICDPVAAGGKRAFPLAYDDILVPIWDNVRPKLLEILHGTNWMTMVPLRWEYAASTAKTTLLFTAETPGPYRWKSISTVLQRQLSQESRHDGIGVEVLSGNSLWEVFLVVVPQTHFLRLSVPDELFFPLGLNSMGVGVQCDQLSNSGTLGGYICLKDGQNNRRTFGLTCHHAIVWDGTGYLLPQRTLSRK